MSHEVQALKQKLDDVSKRLVKRTANYKFCEENFQTEKKSLEDFKRISENLMVNSKDKQDKLLEQEEKLKDLKQQEKEKKNN